MNWDVTYRTVNGRVEKRTLSGARKNDVVDMVKKRGDVPLGITESKGRGNGRVSRGLLRWVLGIAGAGMIGAGVWMCLSGPERGRPQEEKRNADRAAVPQKEPSPRVKKETQERAAAPVERIVEPQKETAATNTVPPGHIRLPTGLQLRYILPPEGKTRKLVANGEIWEIDHTGNATNISPPPLFTKPFERTLSALAHRDGVVLPDVIAEYSREDVLKWCQEPTEYFDDDTEEDLRKRRTVAEMKGMVYDYLSGGGEFGVFVRDVQTFSEAERRFHATGLQEITKAIKDGRIQDARLTVEAMNKLTEEKGYAPLMIPGRYKKMLEGE